MKSNAFSRSTTLGSLFSYFFNFPRRINPLSSRWFGCEIPTGRGEGCPIWTEEKMYYNTQAVTLKRTYFNF